MFVMGAGMSADAWVARVVWDGGELCVSCVGCWGSWIRLPVMEVARIRAASSMVFLKQVWNVQVYRVHTSTSGQIIREKREPNRLSARSGAPLVTQNTVHKVQSGNPLV